MAVRRGFTLFEVVLVLAIIVVIAAITYPSVEAMYSDQKLTDAGDSVRTRWATARSRSINEGVPYRFAVVWGESNWRVAPDTPEFWNGESSAELTEGVHIIEAGNLPHDIRFIAGDSVGPEAGTKPSPIPEEMSTDRYTRLIVFNPDGSTQCYLSENESPEVLDIALQGKSNRKFTLTFRSLTGVSNTRWDSVNLAH